MVSRVMRGFSIFVFPYAKLRRCSSRSEAENSLSRAASINFCRSVGIFVLYFLTSSIMIQRRSPFCSPKHRMCILLPDSLDAYGLCRVSLFKRCLGESFSIQYSSESSAARSRPGNGLRKNVPSVPGEGEPTLNQNGGILRLQAYWIVWMPPTVQSRLANFEAGGSGTSLPPLSPPESFSPAIASRS